GPPGGGAALSAHPEARERPADAVAGLLASLSIFASLIGVAYRPGRLIPGALLLALLAVAMGGRHLRLAGFATGIGGACFVIGMAAAVITDNPLF
ncbi:MAG: hypothetical protein M3R39_02905, partial [Actinomycetota bacterium]|nr:hypothetical protein [Actinomycetota bacterium]